MGTMNRERALLTRLVEWNDTVSHEPREPFKFIVRDARALLAEPEGCNCIVLGERRKPAYCSTCGGYIHDGASSEPEGEEPAPSAIEAALEALVIAARNDRYDFSKEYARVLALARPPLSRAEAEGMVEAGERLIIERMPRFWLDAAKDAGVQWCERYAIARATLLAALTGQPTPDAGREG